MAASEPRPGWLQQFLSSDDPEQTIFRHLEEVASGGGDTGAHWRPGEKLKLLLAGYCGAGNVGTEMRTGEIVRQIRHLLGAGNLEFTALSMSPNLPEDVLPAVRNLRLASGYIPQLIETATRDHHGTVACEGSMFKSTFANVLSGIMASALGAAANSGKLSVGYGAEVAGLDPLLDSFVRSNVGEALILCRNEVSYRNACTLGLRAAAGTDTAWAFAAAPPDEAAKLLHRLGWNGSDPVLAICPMNPFWWPVRPSPRRAVEMQKTGAHRAHHFASVFFHSASPDIERKYRTYIAELAKAVRSLAARRGAFPVIVVMDRVDLQAAHHLAATLGGQTAILQGSAHTVAEVVAILRRSDLLISSRFHALVGAMPAGVASIGIAMDERIANLLRTDGQVDRLIAADDPDLGRRIVMAAEAIDRDAIRQSSRRIVGDSLVAMSRMGEAFVREVARRLPDFPLPVRPAMWTEYIAPLPADVEEFVAG